MPRRLPSSDQRVGGQRPRRSSLVGWQLGSAIVGWRDRLSRLVALFRVVFALAFGVLLLLSF
jgi:hypothetical protein